MSGPSSTQGCASGEGQSCPLPEACHAAAAQDHLQEYAAVPWYLLNGGGGWGGGGGGRQVKICEQQEYGALPSVYTIHFLLCGRLEQP